MLESYGVDARSRFIDLASMDGQARVLVSGSGPPVVMINGIGTPGAMWAPAAIAPIASRFLAAAQARR